MGKLKALLPLTLALLIAVGGSFTIYKWMEQQSTPAQAEVVTAKIQTVPVVVAATDLAWGTELTTEMLKVEKFLKQSLPPGYHSEPQPLVGRIVIAPCQTNEPVTTSRLAPEDVATGGVAAVLENGMRAVAVSGNKISGISGFIQPGNKVDVLVTMEDPGAKEPVTKLVLESIPVLATGTQIQHNANGEPAPVDVYTLKVTPSDAEKLTLAASRGQLQFALRNIKDTETVLTPGAKAGSTLASLRAAAPEPKKTATKRAPRRQVQTVEIINGDSRTTKKF